MADKPLRRPSWLFLGGGLLLCLLAALAAYGFFLERAKTHLQESNGQRLDFYAASLESTLAKHEPLPYLAGLERDVRAALAHPGADTVAAANRYLAMAQREAKVSALYLLDAEGLTLAASNWNNSQSFVGQRYTFRPYFREALAGGTGRFYAVGATTREPGYFIAAPVKLDGRIRGVVVAKVSLEDFERDLARSGDRVALADSGGVLFLSAVADWKYRTLGPLPPDLALRLAETRQYGDHPLSALLPGQRLDGDLPVQEVALKPQAGSGKYLLLSRPVGPLNWRILSFTDLAEARQTAGGQAAAVGFATALGLLLLGVRRLQQHRQEERQAAAVALRRVHDELEFRIAERTEALTVANQQLHERLAQVERAEAILRQTRDDAVQAGKLAVLGQLAAGITHEINQPLAALTTLSGNAVKFLERGDQNEVRDNLHLIEELAQRLGRIVGQFKAFARKAPAELTAVSVAEAVQLARVIVEPRRREMNARIDSDFPAEALLVRADPVRLEQVLVNLIKNGLEASARQAAPRLFLSAGRDGGRVRLCLQDNGPGIPAEVLPHLFEPFYSTKGDSEGLGLGLAISRAIVESFGGSLTAGNREEGGAEFVIMLDAA
ncbi:ATP-binding protein [Denitratisoma sp. agr-D3]